MKRLQGEGELLEERVVMRDEGEGGMLDPEGAEFGVKCDGLIKCLVADGIAAFNGGAADGGGLEENDGVIASQFVRHGGVERFKVGVAGTWPVGGAIDCATVAEEDAVGIKAEVFVFEVALHVIDGGLGVAQGGGLSGAGESALKEDGGGFGHDHDRVADFTAK